MLTDRFRLYAAGAALLLLVIGYVSWRQYERGVGARDAELRILQRRVDSLTTVAAHVDTMIQHDTVRLRAATGRFAALEARADTLWLHDTIPVPVPVVRAIVAAADTALVACSITVTDCTRQVGIQKALVADLTRQLSLVKAERPSVLSRCGLSVGYGVVLSDWHAGPTVVAGCRLLP